MNKIMPMPPFKALRFVRTYICRDCNNIFTKYLFLSLTCPKCKSRDISRLNILH